MTTNDKSQLVDDVERIALLVSAAPKDRRSELCAQYIYNRKK